MIYKIKYIVYIFIILTVSCKVSEKTSTPRNLERIYDPSSSTIHPRIEIYNTSDTSSLIVERIFNSELLFNQANDEKQLVARVMIIYNLYDLNNKQNLTDSLTTTFKFKKDKSKLYQTIEISVNALKGNNYLLEIITTDLNRRSNHYTFHKVDRRKEINLQDFLVVDTINEEYFVEPYLNKKKRFRIQHYQKNIDSMRVYFYSNEFYVPPPPYQKDSLSDIFEQPDTIWTCYLDSIQYHNFEKEGVYYFTNNFESLDINQGFTLFNFGEVFPVVQTPQDLADPIKYLGKLDSIPETDSIGKHTKLAVDDFWLSRVNNIDKSRELLRAYYNRVMLANKYFTSYKEGWQTDRGMIYIIYGLPDYLYKSGDEERWIYNPVGIGTGITFTFKHIEHPFSLNHYMLDRDKLKTTGWDNAVELWNNGEVFYFQN